MSKHVLVVDQDPAVRARLSRALSGHGHTVDTAPTGSAALQRLTARAFDAALVDVCLPDMTGFEMLAQIAERWPQLPVAMVAEYLSVPSDVVELLGARTLLTKGVAEDTAPIWVENVI